MCLCASGCVDFFGTKRIHPKVFMLQLWVNSLTASVCMLYGVSVFRYYQFDCVSFPYITWRQMALCLDDIIGWTTTTKWPNRFSLDSIRRLFHILRLPNELFVPAAFSALICVTFPSFSRAVHCHDATIGRS